jgi:hypothetical protein
LVFTSSGSSTVFGLAAPFRLAGLQSSSSDLGLSNLPSDTFIGASSIPLVHTEFLDFPASRLAGLSRPTIFSSSLLNSSRDGETRGALHHGPVISNLQSNGENRGEARLEVSLAIGERKNGETRGTDESISCASSSLEIGEQKNGETCGDDESLSSNLGLGEQHSSSCDGLLIKGSSEIDRVSLCKSFSTIVIIARGTAEASPLSKI